MKRTMDPTARLFQALGDPVRLSIVRQLAGCEVCACDFTAGAEVSQPTVSHHLRVLREAGVVRAERRGTWIYYALEPAVAGRLRELAGSLEPGPPQPAAMVHGAAPEASGPVEAACADCASGPEGERIGATPGPT